MSVSWALGPLRSSREPGRSSPHRPLDLPMPRAALAPLAQMSPGVPYGNRRGAALRAFWAGLVSLVTLERDLVIEHELLAGLGEVRPCQSIQSLVPEPHR